MICDYLYYKQLCYLYVCLYVLFTFPTSRVVILLVITVTKMYPHMYICVYVNVYAWHMHTSNRPWFCRCGREYTHKKQTCVCYFNPFNWQPMPRVTWGPACFLLIVYLCPTEVSQQCRMRNVSLRCLHHNESHILPLSWITCANVL